MTKSKTRKAGEKVAAQEVGAKPSVHNGEAPVMPATPEAALVLADPAVRDFVEATAHAHGIPLLPADDDALVQAARRAAVIHAAVGAVGAALRGQAGLPGQAGTKSSA